MSKTYYHYIKNTGYYAGSSINPLNDNRGSTDIAPPPTNPGERAVWDGEAWKVVTRGVSKRQAHQQLVLSGLYDQAESAIEDIEDEVERKLTQIWFRDAAYWEFGNEELHKMAEKLGLGEEDVKDFLRDAEQL